MMTPQRIQLSRAKGWRMPENTVKVDRSTRWGNPFRMADLWFPGQNTQAEATRMAVDHFRDWLARPAQVGLAAEIKEKLRGKNLACWCKPCTPCHADVLLEIANA
jgi:hypothetical protein